MIDKSRETAHAPQTQPWLPLAGLCVITPSIMTAFFYINMIKIYYFDYHSIFVPYRQALGGDFIHIWSSARLVLSNRVHDIYDYKIFSTFEKVFWGIDSNKLGLSPPFPVTHFRLWFFFLSCLFYLMGGADFFCLCRGRCL